MVVLALLIPLSLSCSADQARQDAKENGRSGEAGSEGSGGASGGDAGGASNDGNTQAAPEEPLVPVAHLTSMRESISTAELERDEDLAVPREARKTAAGLLDRSGFEGPGTTDEVVDHVSRTPGALDDEPSQSRTGSRPSRPLRGGG